MKAERQLGSCCAEPVVCGDRCGRIDNHADRSECGSNGIGDGVHKFISAEEVCLRRVSESTVRCYRVAAVLRLAGLSNDLRERTTAGAYQQALVSISHQRLVDEQGQFEVGCCREFHDLEPDSCR